MKLLFNKMIVTAAFTLFASSTNAQKTTVAMTPWASDKGYWVIESNIHDPMNHIVRFYTNENVLLHTEYLSGVKLNIDKRKVKMKLKKALEETWLLCEQHKKPDAISGYISAMFLCLSLCRVSLIAFSFRSSSENDHTTIL
ncbi:MAG: hypothetical protein ABUT20_35425 [Bacteroidota bacterium]